MGEPLNLCLSALAPLLLQFATLQPFLARDAMPRPRNRLQPPFIDLIAALFAFAVGAFGDAEEGALHHLQQPPLVIALGEQELLLIGA